jgi:hypothetical protein
MKFIKAFLLTTVFCFLSLTPAYANYDSLSEKKISEFKRPRINTPLTEVELFLLLKNTHTDVFGFEASNARLAVAWSQTALECGRGAKVYNRNIGNIGARKNQLYYAVATHQYRHFLSFEDGAKAYWRVLKKCSSALNAFDSSSPMLAAAALKRCKYYDADEEHYAKTMQSLYYRALKVIDLSISEKSDD